MNTLFFKAWIFIVLSIQTTFLLLLMRYSKMEGFKPYSSTSAVLHTEIIKYFCYSFLLFYRSDWKLKSTFTTWKNEVLYRPKETLKMLLPAVLYTIQNNLLYYSLSVLNVATFQITYQLRILTTGLVTGWILKRWLKPLQWVAVSALAFGVAMVEMNPNDDMKGIKKDKRTFLLGILSVVLACFTSAFAGVYYEMLVKLSEQPSVMIRNLQLGLFALPQALLAHLLKETSLWSRKLYENFNVIVWTIVLLQAVSGLIVAGLIKYTDNIEKGFATSLSILISSICSSMFFRDLNLGPEFAVGMVMVLLSTVGYAYVS